MSDATAYEPGGFYEFPPPGWDPTGETPVLSPTPVQALNEAAPPASLITPWDRLDELSRDGVPFRVDGIWPSEGLGFIAASPKKGKTWLGLGLAISVATGRPFLGRYKVDRCPVLYVALEGSPSGTRARIGALSRGMGIDPDSDDLRKWLHMSVKPRGINLSESAWASRLVADADAVGAGLVIVDVLRRAAAVREGGEGVGDFAALLRNLEPLQGGGRGVVFLHHFRKVGKSDDETDAGERMAGSGSLHGHYDVAMFITDVTREMTMSVQVDARDFAPPRPFKVAMEGPQTGPYGWCYEDTVQLVPSDRPVRQIIKGAAEDIRAFIAAGGGSATPKAIRERFEITDPTLKGRRDELARLGVVHQNRGPRSVYEIVASGQLETSP
jgi:hypothetical protein